MLLLNSKTSFLGWGAVLAFAIGPSIASAQIGMAEDERSVLAINPGEIDERNGHGTIYNDGTWSAAPLTYNYTGHNADGYGAYNDISVSNYVNYGQLAVSASGDSMSSDHTGCFTWAQNFIGGDITTCFRDNITANEDMDVQYTYTVTAANAFQSNVDGNCGSNVETLIEFASASEQQYLAGDGVVTYTGTVHLLAGSTYSLLVGLGYYSADNSNDLAGRYSSFSTSGDGTFSLDVLTAGATYTAQSGHTYAVPEPISLSILGFGALAMLRRKRS